jgi:hypothetical protein
VAWRVRGRVGGRTGGSLLLNGGNGARPIGRKAF